MREEKNRLETFKDCNFSVNSHVLAKAGFYYTHKANLLECSMCHFQIDATNVNKDENRIIALHKKEKPECTFNQNVKRSISKKFDSYDSLRFEKERLDTYIDWPLEWLEPSDLARDGFYYLRTNDHVACVFCRGIVGSWERGDTPRGEHQRHFPHCQFIRNQPVGNFPLIFNEKFEGYSIPLRNSKNSSYRQGIDVCGLSPMTDNGIDVCGLSPMTDNGIDVCGLSPMTDNGIDVCGLSPMTDNGIDVCGLSPTTDNGVHQHTIAKRKDYLTLESRLASFNNWPERVTQKPTELSEAGFFYCGLSDHVRCYHCGNGLRNWETDDIPWDEHARWYPECTFLFLMKGKEFIDQVCQLSNLVQGERSPYETNPSITHINEDQHKLIKELDITKHLISMGFQEDHVMTTYHNQLKEKGLPFFDIGSFIEAVLQYMEDEVRKCLVNKLALAEVDVVPSPPMSDRNELASDTNQQVESSTTLMELALAEPIVDELALAEVGVVPSQPMSDGTEVESTIVDELTLTEVDVAPSPPMSGDSNPQPLFGRITDQVAALPKSEVPCNHICTCLKCASNISTCPICRAEIKYTIKAIIS
ncbi:baculoviral IAP repeat-containing protein 7-like [Procambarus clarkii]|uniref:baculoviral IAP repeat-containing protein 7-like n=1 Tax=Procambarus clarkii TaxID=6728 RepID=UPI003743A7D3